VNYTIKTAKFLDRRVKKFLDLRFDRDISWVAHPPSEFLHFLELSRRKIRANEMIAALSKS
jgi:hypothetical protein